MSKRITTGNEGAEAAGKLHVGPGIVQAHQRIAAVHLSRRLAQVMLSVVDEQVPKPSARNEFGALVAVARTPNLDQKRLAAMMAFDTTTIGQLVDNLESKGYVRRTASAADRRVNIIEITELGRKVVAEYQPKVLKAQNDALACLTSAEKQTLLDLMVRVIEANPAHDRPGGGRRAPKRTTD
jgi:DNA-binding MarR family transcriptional regulator